MFVNSLTSFYALRFLLGVAEAGFFPGIIWYLTQWYTRAHRAQIVALFMTAIALSGVVGGPVSGLILNTHGRRVGPARLALALPPRGRCRRCSWAFAVLRYLDDGPADAAWLTPDERALVAAPAGRGRRPEARRRATRPSGVGRRLPSWRVWACCAIYFSAVMGIYGVTFWLPQIISETISPDPLARGPGVDDSLGRRRGRRWCWWAAAPTAPASAAGTSRSRPGSRRAVLLPLGAAEPVGMGRAWPV